MCFTDLGDLLTGDSNGSIMFWPRGSNRTAKIIHNAHEFGVFSICVLKDGTVMTGGGKDRRVVEWDSGLNKTGREARVINMKMSVLLTLKLIYFFFIIQLNSVTRTIWRCKNFNPRQRINVINWNNEKLYPSRNINIKLFNRNTGNYLIKQT